MVLYSHVFKNFSVLVIHNEAEIVFFFFFLELSCFIYDLVNVGNLIPGFSAFSKSSFYIGKFLVLRLQKPSLEDFEHNLAINSM